MTHGQYHNTLFAYAMKPCPMAMDCSVVGLGSIRRNWRNALVTVKATKHAEATT